MMCKFENDEAGYVDWLNAHRAERSGYVINSTRNFRPESTVLHRSTCKSISPEKKGYREGAYTGGQYIKFCGTTIDEAKREFSRAGGKPQVNFPRACLNCAP